MDETAVKHFPFAKHRPYITLGFPSGKHSIHVGRSCINSEQFMHPELDV
jgi:hypothetical protein